MNDSQLLSVKMIDWINGAISDKEMISELLPVVMELDVRVAKLEKLVQDYL